MVTMLVKIELQWQTTFVNSLAKLTGLIGERLFKKHVLADGCLNDNYC